MKGYIYITNLDGEIVQHVEYVPFGEVFIEERNNSWNTPYLFNGKELDEETGLYYYGARYYNPRESVWLSVDPLAEKYPNVSSYAYVFQNPIKYIDPRGLEGVEPGEPPASSNERSLDPIVIVAKTKSWFNRNIWKPITSIFRNKGSKITKASENKYITTTNSLSSKYSIPENQFFSASVHNTTTYGSPGIVNIDNKATITGKQSEEEYSQDYQLDLGIIKGNFEVTKESAGTGVGVSLFGRADIGVGITLNADILNSEIFLSGNENINGDSSSNGFSVGIKPAGMIIGVISFGLRRIVPPTVLDPAIYTPIFGPPQNNNEIH